MRPDGLDCGVGSFGVGVAFGDAVGVGVAVGVLFGVGVLVGVGVTVGVAVVVGVGVCIEGCASFSSLKPPSPPSSIDMSCSCWSSWAGSASCSSELAGSMRLAGAAANCICCAGESGSAGDVLLAGDIACSASCRRFCEVCVLAAEALVFSLLSGVLSLRLPTVSRRGFCLGEGVFMVTSSSLTGTPTTTATPRASALADVA